MNRIINLIMFVTIMSFSLNASVPAVKVGAVEITDMVTDEEDEQCLNCGIEISTESLAGEKLMVALYVLDNNGKHVKNEVGKMIDPIVYSIRPEDNYTHAALDVPIPIKLIPEDANDLKLHILVADESCTIAYYNNKNILIPMEDIKRSLTLKEGTRMAIGLIDVIFGDGGSFGGGNRSNSKNKCYYCHGSGQCQDCKYQAACERDCSECTNTGRCRYCNGSGESMW